MSENTCSWQQPLLSDVAGEMKITVLREKISDLKHFSNSYLMLLMLLVLFIFSYFGWLENWRVWGFFIFIFFTFLTKISSWTV